MLDKTYRLAIRKRKDSIFWEEENYQFTEVKIRGKRYWQADPFLFDYMDRTFLFYELFDRV